MIPFLRKIMENPQQNVQLLRLGKRVYRHYSSDRMDTQIITQSYTKTQGQPEIETEDVIIQEKQVIPKKLWKFEKLKVDKHFHKFIIGRQGSTKREIERSTNSELIIPGFRSRLNEIEIRAPTDEAISAAKEKVLEIIKQVS